MYNSKDLTSVIHALTNDEVKHILREKYRRSLYHTATGLLGMMDVNMKTHGAMIKSLENQDTKRKLIVMPRGSLKSSLGVVAYSIWTLIKNPNERILVDSAIYQNSKNFIREIKGHMESEYMTYLFGNFRSPNNWGEGSITINQRTKIFKESSVTASGIGASKVSQHYDVILMDDMNAESNSNTIDGRRKVLDHYKRNVAILEPDGILSVTATRYASDDLPGHVLDKELEITDLGN